ncbi:substrate-binding domain-containing protein [Paenarthrobacter sp. RAF54_2]|uniref:substrate-binding domain-containing protein n=1 Tax=Paenarthrobacter sp. RAF54_2 TaxID=3233061 RepID=UPI003F957713
MFKKIAIAAVTVAASLSLAACSGAAGSGSSGGGDSKQKTIGLAVANQQADFFNQIRQAVEAEAKAENVKVVVADAKGDSNTQVSQIQDFITQQVDAIIYIPAGATAATVPVKAAKSANIPIVTVDRNPEGAPGNTFIATDSVKAAKALGEWVGKTVNGTGKLGVIQGQIGTTPEQARDEGFKSAMTEFPGITEVARQASKQWAQDEGFQIATDMIQANPGINIFFGRADALALGAAQAAKNAGLENVTVVGFDGDVAGLKAVQDGTLAATICQPTQKMGKLAVESAVKLINGEKLPAEQLQDGVLTTKENVAPFISNHP